MTAYQSLVCLWASPVEGSEIILITLRCAAAVKSARSKPRSLQASAAEVVQQIIKIIEMLARRPHGLAKDARVRALAIDEALAHSLVHHRLASLAVELDVEPFGHASNFGSKRCIAMDHRHSIDRLVEIFDDGL